MKNVAADSSYLQEETGESLLSQFAVQDMKLRFMLGFLIWLVKINPNHMLNCFVLLTQTENR